MPRMFDKLRSSGAFRAAQGPFVGASDAVLNLLGLAAGGVATRRFPRWEADPNLPRKGRMVFDAEEGATPLTLGDVQIIPAGATPRSRAHEDEHVRQANEYGAAYPLVSLLGGEHGPLEEEAYSKVAAIPATTPYEGGEVSADKMTLSEIRKSKGPSRRFLEGLLGRL